MQEKELLLKEKEMLEKSISRREKLLSNENYLNKAPSDIVNVEKESLLREKVRYNLIVDKLK